MIRHSKAPKKFMMLLFMVIWCFTRNNMKKLANEFLKFKKKEMNLTLL